jgi:hypothetical protein
MHVYLYLHFQFKENDLEQEVPLFFHQYKEEVLEYTKQNKLTMKENTLNRSRYL